MQKKRVQNACPLLQRNNGETYKTWELVAPYPDKEMRITVTIFGMFKCPLCEQAWGVVDKAKMGTAGKKV
jgi:hypothetical protein